MSSPQLQSIEDKKTIPGNCPRCSHPLQTCQINFEQCLDICKNFKCTYPFQKGDKINIIATKIGSEAQSPTEPHSNMAAVQLGENVNNPFDIDEFLATDFNLEMFIQDFKDFTELFDVSYLNNLQGNN